MSCAELETIAAWCLGELPEADGERFEEHYFSCEHCTEQVARMFRLLEQLNASLPPVLTPERRRALEAAQPLLSAVRVPAGGRARMRMTEDAPFGLWLMEAPLQGVTRVDVEARAPDGALVFAFRDVPFDESRGQVVLACQLHYRAMPMAREMHAKLMAHGPGGERPTSEYVLDHEFEGV